VAALVANRRPCGAGGAVGSPATRGTALATYLARQVLRRAAEAVADAAGRIYRAVHRAGAHWSAWLDRTRKVPP
jgi:hypothetical protein